MKREETKEETGLALMSSRIAAGFPSPAEDYIERRVDLNSELIAHPAASFMLRTKGNSMVGEGIFDGDILVVDKSLEARNGRVVIAVHEGELTVKKLKIRKGKGTLVAAAEGFPDIELNDDSQIWGVVTWCLHPL